MNYFYNKTPSPSLVSSNPLGTHGHLFHLDEDIHEALNYLSYLWEDMCHDSLLFPWDAFKPSPTTNQYILDAKDFTPHDDVDWFKNPIPYPYTFEEGNMKNIYSLSK